MLFFASLAVGLAVPAQDTDTNIAPAQQQASVPTLTNSTQASDDAWGDQWVKDTKKMEHNVVAASQAQMAADQAEEAVEAAKDEASKALKQGDSTAAAIYNAAIKEAQRYVSAAKTAAKKATSAGNKWDANADQSAITGLIKEAKEAAKTAKDVVAKCKKDIQAAEAQKEKQLKQELGAAERGRGLRNGDPKNQTPEERCEAKLADCRDFRDGAHHTPDECHETYRKCLATAEKKEAKEAEAAKAEKQAAKAEKQATKASP